MFVLGSLTLLAGCAERVYVGPSGQYAFSPSVEQNEFHENVRDSFISLPEEVALHEKINLYRQDMGFLPLELTDTISFVCREHSKAMANGDVAFGHDGFDDRFDILSQQISLDEVAENVAMAYDVNNPIANIIDDWLNSEGHRKNIEGDYHLTGVGVANSDDGYVYFTQMFLR